MSEATRAENVAPKPYDLEAHYQELEQKITAAGIPADLGRVRAAFECADRAHSGQKRRDGSPYVSHCIAAAIITAEMGLDEDSIIAALLHDTIEDTSLTHEDIARSFGTSVADIVEGVTKLTRVQYTSVEEQQMENMRKMLLAMAKDIRVILIKMADRLHNMRTMAYQSEEKQRIKSLETMEIYAPIAHRLGMQKIKWELEDLSLLYLDPAGYKAITDALDERMPTLEKFMGEMRTQIRERLEADGVHATISSRIKHIYSIYRKMYAQKLDINGIFDLCAFRVIVDTIPDCYNVLGIIHDMYKPLPGRFKDYISTPKPNMYQSVHTTVIGSEGIPFEVQIRTWEMHMTAEYGVAAHWKYKTGSGEGHQARRRGEVRLDPPPARDAAGVRRAGLFPQPEGGHVCRRGVRVLAEGRCDQPARRRDANRLCLQHPLRDRQQHGRRDGQRPHRELRLRAAKRRHCGHPHVEKCARPQPRLAQPRQERRRAHEDQAVVQKKSAARRTSSTARSSLSASCAPTASPRPTSWATRSCR